MAAGGFGYDLGTVYIGMQTSPRIATRGAAKVGGQMKQDIRLSDNRVDHLGITDVADTRRPAWMTEPGAPGGIAVSGTDIAQQLLGMFAEVLEIGLVGNGRGIPSSVREVRRCPQRDAKGTMRMNVGAGRTLHADRRLPLGAVLQLYQQKVVIRQLRGDGCRNRSGCAPCANNGSIGAKKASPALPTTASTSPAKGM